MNDLFTQNKRRVVHDIGVFDMMFVDCKFAIIKDFNDSCQSGSNGNLRVCQLWDWLFVVGLAIASVSLPGS